MARPFDSKEDERMRLDQTICTWQGEPVYIETDLDMMLGDLRAKRLGGRKWYEIKTEADDFSYAAPRLGYYEHEADSVYWMYRHGRRQYKAGLPIERGLLARPPHKEEFVPPAFLLLTKAMKDCIVGLDRSIEEALEVMKEGKRPSAVINREFALVKRDQRFLELHYCGRACGHVVGNQPRLWDAPDASFVGMAMQKIKGF